MKHLILFESGFYMEAQTGAFDGNYSGLGCTKHISDAHAFDNMRIAQEVANRTHGSIVSMTVKELFHSNLKDAA